MQYSIKRKLISIFLLFAAMVLVISYAINAFVLREYYIVYKRTTFIEIYNEINEISNNDGDISNEYYQEMLLEICETAGITLLIMDSDDEIIFNYGNEDASIDRLVDIMFETDDDSDYTTKVITKYTERGYTFQIAENNETEQSYFEMWGALDDGNSFIIRMAYQGIEDSVYVTNRVFIVASLLMIMFFSYSMYWVSLYFTKPIKDLSDISKKMMDLDFEAKYTDDRNDEIDILGKNMNELSSKLKETIAELKAANLELQKDIAKKDEIDKQRREFLSNVSHELKTPIALVQGYAEGLKEGINDDQESRDFYCDVIMDESKKMNNIVKKLLSLNQLEFGENHVSMECFDIVQVVNGMLNSVDILLKQKNVNVYFDNSRPIHVWADEFQIEEVLNNYISNALNHVCNENIIKIVIDDSKEDVVRVNIFNTGKLIPEESLKNLWDKFYKVDKARTREYGGSGLGLSIVKAIMESMNQKYGIENTEGGVVSWFEVEKNSNCKKTCL